MNRQKLTELIQYPERISARDVSMLTDMAVQYPYATVIQILLAKSKQQHADARHSLATAALYTPNRAVLRQVMENSLPSLSPSAEATPPAAETATSATISPASPPQWETQPTSTDTTSAIKAAAEEPPQAKADVFEELQRNLKRLREERSNWYLKPKEQSTAQQAPAVENTPAPDTETSSTRGSGMTSTLQQIVEEHEEQPLENPRVQQQRSLINSFLENASTLQRRQAAGSQPNDEITDLSQHVSQMSQDLATETLAKIMERQGKAAKALDIYQKLILKYPQKSAYFADCIERLKKDLG